MKLKVIPLNEILKYLYVIFLLFCMGTPLYSLYVPVFNTICCVLSVIAFFICKYKLKKRNCIIALTLILTILISALFNFDTDISGYLGYIVPIIAGLIGAELLKDDFEVRLIKTVSCMSVLSLIFYIIGLISPSFVMRLPTIAYRNFKSLFYLQIFEFDPNWATSLIAFRRNCGWYREPGMYATVLVITLSILWCGNNKLDCKYEKKNKIYEIILLVTLGTTFSTAGLIAFIFLILARTRILGKRIDIKKILVMLFVGFSFLYKFKDTFLSKFKIGSDSYISYYDRMRTTFLDLKIWSENFLFGVGITRYEAISEGTVNSLSLVLSCFGIVLFLIFVYLIKLYWNRNCKKRGMFFGVLSLLIILSQQVIVTFPLFYVLLFSNNLKKQHNKLIHNSEYRKHNCKE